MARELANSVVVITGASSGIGRAAARQFAERGARMVLAGRNEAPLRAVAEECSRLGERAMAISTDVRSEEAVRELARRAAEQHGRIDVWVNCAGVMAYGRFEEVPAEVFRAVIETNFFGQVNGARAALPHFRRQQSGVLINLGSVWGRVTTPHVSAYVASKFALRGFSECLSHELRADEGIDVALLLPHAVDTPIFHRSANYSGRSIRPIPPVLHPETVAGGIVRCASSPKREVTYGYTARALEALHAFLPPVYHRLLPAAFESGTFRDEPAAPIPGTVLDAVETNYDIHGGWNRARRRELARAFLATARGIVRAAIGADRGTSA